MIEWVNFYIFRISNLNLHFTVSWTKSYIMVPASILANYNSSVSTCFFKYFVKYPNWFYHFSDDRFEKWMTLIWAWIGLLFTDVFTTFNHDKHTFTIIIIAPTLYLWWIVHISDQISKFYTTWWICGIQNFLIIMKFNENTSHGNVLYLVVCNERNWLGHQSFPLLVQSSFYNNERP